MAGNYDDEPSVMGAGAGIPQMPTRAEADVIWRAAYVARMVECGIHIEDAQACCDAGPANLLEEPAAAADAELEYWNSDESEAPHGR